MVARRRSSTPHGSLSALLHDIDPRVLIRIACAAAGITEYEIVELRYHDPRIEIPGLDKRAGEFAVDLVYTIRTADGRIVDLWLFEIQISHDPKKIRRWTLYVAAFENELDVDGHLVLVSPEPLLRERIRVKQLSRVRASTIVIERDQIERITDYTQARARPQLAILGALYHAHEPAPLDDRVAAFRAAWVALQSLAVDRCLRYAVAVMDIVPSDVIEQGLEELCEAGELDEQRTDELFAFTRSGNLFQWGLREGREQGREEGRRELLRGVVIDSFELRGLTLTHAQRERIEACESLEALERWYAAIKARTTDLDVDQLLR